MRFQAADSVNFDQIFHVVESYDIAVSKLASAAGFDFIVDSNLPALNQVLCFAARADGIYQFQKLIQPNWLQFTHFAAPLRKLDFTTHEFEAVV